MALSIKHQAVIKRAFFRRPTSEETVHVRAAYLDLRRDGAAGDPLDRRDLTRNWLIQISVRFGTHCENGHVDWTPLGAGNPQLGGTSKGYRANVLGAPRKIGATHLPPQKC